MNAKSMGSISPQDLAETLRGVTGLLGFSASIAILGHAASKFVSGSLKLTRELVSIATVIVAVVLLDTIASALDMMNEMSLGKFIQALIASNFALYAVASVILVAVVWQLARILEHSIFRSAAPASEKREEPGTAQPRQTRATSDE